METETKRLLEIMFQENWTWTGEVFPFDLSYLSTVKHDFNMTLLFI